MSEFDLRSLIIFILCIITMIGISVYCFFGIPVNVDKLNRLISNIKIVNSKVVNDKFLESSADNVINLYEHDALMQMIKEETKRKMFEDTRNSLINFQ